MGKYRNGLGLVRVTLYTTDFDAIFRTCVRLNFHLLSVDQRY